MLKLICAACGGKTHYEAVKPSFCSFCSEPFNRVAAAARPAVKVLPGKSVTERVREMEAAQEEIPVTFDIRAEGAATGVGGQRIMVDQQFLKSVPSFERGGDGGTGVTEVDSRPSKVKEEVMKRLLDTTPTR